MPLNLRGAIDPRQAGFLRIVWGGMLFSLCMYAYALVLFRGSSIMPPDRAFQLAMLVPGIVTASVVLYLRFVRLPGLFSADGPTDEKTRVVQLRLNYILCFVFSEVTALALGVMHADPTKYRPMYLGGVLLMVVCFPRLPWNE